MFFPAWLLVGSVAGSRTLLCTCIDVLSRGDADCMNECVDLQYHIMTTAAATSACSALSDAASDAASDPASDPASRLRLCQRGMRRAPSRGEVSVSGYM